jgi:hypothetical protein
MRRGQTREERNTEGFTKQQLLDAGQVSSGVFDTIRKAARVRGPTHGGLNWIFTREEIGILIQRARSGRFTERGPAAAEGWERLLRDGPDESVGDDEFEDE